MDQPARHVLELDKHGGEIIALTFTWPLLLCVISIAQDIIHNRYEVGLPSALLMNDTIVDLVPFLGVRDVQRSISFYEALGFSVVKTYAPLGTLEFAALQATSSAKVMLARVDAVPSRDPDEPGPGFLYLYTPDLDAFRARLVRRGIDAGEIQEGPGPGPNREVCVRDPDGHGHMVAELWEGSVARDPRARKVRPAASASTTASPRQIGPIGTVSRIVAGLLLLAFPVVTHGIGAWDVAAALIAFPLIASALHSLISAAYDRYLAGWITRRTTARSTRAWLINLSVLGLIIAIATGMTFVTPVDAGAIWLFFGASLLIVAARGDAGCEVLAFVNAIAGHRDTTGCVAFAPVDSLEAKLTRNASPRVAGPQLETDGEADTRRSG